ncbi:cytochrome ubiquinol oxidase subunit II [Sphingomonas sp. PsM26]|nr:cytochrome ubiquinol oxidase subunit II [Sphingomonas sp. PsM26]
MGIVLSAALGGCAALDHGFLAAAGPVAGEQRELFWIVAAILTFVAGPVLILTPIIAWHYRQSNTDDAYRPEWNFSWTLEGFIWIPPMLIVALLAVLLWSYTHRLDPYRPIGGRSPLDVQVIASDWKWLFIYPETGVASVDQLVLPVGRPIRLTLSSTTVMQSLMIPRLTGQIYTMAGMTTHLNLRADQAGRYRGKNMQYNGRGFPHQSFTVVAVDEAGFERWLRRARRAPDLQPSARALLYGRATVPVPLTYSHVPSGFFASVVVASGRTNHAHGTGR